MVVEVKSPPITPRPYPSRSQKLPWTREEVTPELLTDLLQNRYPDVAVESMESVDYIDSHTTKWRMALTYNQAGIDAGLPRNVCLKSNFSGGFDDVDICMLEAQFYYFAQPHMTVPMAKSYYADWDDDGKGHGLVILEDLIELGGKFGHSLDDVGIDKFKLVLDGLAHLHSDLWGSPLLQQWQWLPTSMATPIDNDQIRIMQTWIDKNLEEKNFDDVLPRHFKDNPGKLQVAYDALAEWEHAQTTPLCINLGDCHQGNTYMRPDGTRIWLDWQLVRKGRPWRDLTYMMIGSLTVDERRKYERELIAYYREQLLSRGVSGVPSADDIFENYRRWVIYGMQAWVANMDHWGQTGKPMNERFFTAGEDLETWKALGCR
ncbi:MAG: aminoglycoside phosphotransferase [Porticoccaceae bacterium]|nr:aminoglycoside phosphotransferase [Porticoccaceae bacterium]